MDAGVFQVPEDFRVGDGGELRIWNSGHLHSSFSDFDG
jgi:hypothetical protein